jgi:hypothetical protein
MKNKKLLLGVALAVVAGLLLYNKAKADVGGVIDVTYVSERLFRGTVRADNAMQVSGRTAVGITDDLVLDVQGLYTGSVDGDSRELDIDVGTSFNVTKGLRLDVGTVIYEYINSPRSTDTELYSKLTLTEFPLQPGVTVFHNTSTDVNIVEGSVSKGIDLGIERLSVAVTGVIGDGDDVTYYGGSLGARYNVTDELSLTAGVSVVRNNTTDKTDTAYSVGVSYLF